MKSALLQALLLTAAVTDDPEGAVNVIRARNTPTEPVRLFPDHPPARWTPEPRTLARNRKAKAAKRANQKAGRKAARKGKKR